MTTKLVLVSRQFSQWLSFFGILQLLFATALAVCGFVTLGLFKNINSYGIWAGLPVGVLLVSKTVVRKSSVQKMFLKI